MSELKSENFETSSKASKSAHTMIRFRLRFSFSSTLNDCFSIKCQFSFIFEIFLLALAHFWRLASRPRRLIASFASGQQLRLNRSNTAFLISAVFVTSRDVLYPSPERDGSHICVNNSVCVNTSFAILTPYLEGFEPGIFLRFNSPYIKLAVLSVSISEVAGIASKTLSSNFLLSF